MNRRTISAAVLLLVLTLGVVVWSSGSWYRTGGHGSSSHAHSHSHQDLKPIDVDPPYPSLSVSLNQKADGKRVLKLSTENFRFRSPVDTSPLRGTVGHAHLFVNGESIAMFYEPRYVLPDFMPGEYQLRITLNEHNSHRPIRAGDRVVSDTLTLNVPESNPGSTPSSDRDR